MFGYVKIYKPELKVREYEQYRAVYCTVCKQLGTKYGHAVRMSLSYDFAFLAALGITAAGVDPRFKKGHCVYNPFKKCSYTDSCPNVQRVYDIVCAAAVIMLYYKLTDDVRDRGFWSGLARRFYRWIIKRKYLSACTSYPNVSLIVEEMNFAQVTAESRSDADIDIASEPTADALGKICRLLSDDDVASRILYRIGYCVGKWVYLADALDDMESDNKHDRFNPLLGKSVSDVVGTMNVCSTESGASFELLGDGVLSPILKNIFYLGMPTEVKRIIDSKEK